MYYQHSGPASEPTRQKNKKRRSIYYAVSSLPEKYPPLTDTIHYAIADSNDKPGY